MLATKEEFQSKAEEIAELVWSKNVAYGDSFARTGEVLRLMYPIGVAPESFDDMLCIVRILDKLFRIANSKEAFGESPYKDTMGYSLLGLIRDEKANK